METWECLLGGGGMENESGVKEPEKVIQAVGGEQEMKSMVDRVGCQQCGMPREVKGSEEWEEAIA